MQFFRWLKATFLPDQIQDFKSAEELKAAFRDRYHHFRLLLTANNRALESMSEMENMLTGGKPFGMTFIRTRTTRLTTSVFEVVRQLKALAPGKYDPLDDRFDAIQKQLKDIAWPETIRQTSKLVLGLDEIDHTHSDQTGRKLASVGELRNRLDLTVPDGFVMTACAYRRFMDYNEMSEEVARILQLHGGMQMENLHEMSQEIRDKIMEAPLPPDLEEQIYEAFDAIAAQQDGPARLAIRSSALGEDTAGQSFAGQYRSMLNIGREKLIWAYKKIVASKYGVQAMAYRLHRGFRDEDVEMCVGAMVMVDAVAGGVAYTASPVDISRDGVVITSVWGLPKAVVDGAVDTDSFVVTRRDPLRIIERNIADKPGRFVCALDEGDCEEQEAGEQAREPSLTDDQIIKIARLSLSVEAHFGVEQDIEWAVGRDGTVYLLQCRPLTLMQPESGTPEDGEADATVPSATGEEVADVLLRGGITGSPGAGYGPVHRIIKDSDERDFPEGGVLVARQAVPRLAPLLAKASAVVAEHGNITGHLASVAREFGVPALFGLHGAMAQLENGQYVTVDAAHHLVVDGHAEELLARAAKKKNLMEGSPVHTTLTDILELTAPLTLVDPDAPSFKAKNCQTLHDITRFCHEKSVREMFAFGTDSPFPELAAKQLYCENPMQFWIINLDDGFSGEPNGNCIDLKNICSIPMLAIWEGMVAVPWDGPPPVDTRGFMSIVMESTMNPSLVPGRSSEFTERNYFMISKNFVSLQSRFGYHFCTVESLVDEQHASENYAAFRFQGGAASLSRRVRRVQFVASILEERGFHVKLSEDTLSARTDGLERPEMEARLRLIGYLLMHTRQLDMVMSKDTSGYRAKFLSDIDDICGEYVCTVRGGLEEAREKQREHTEKELAALRKESNQQADGQDKS